MQVSSATARRPLIFTAVDGASFGAYHDLYSVGSTVSRHGPAFGAAVTAYRFPRLLMFDRQVAGAVHHRDEARVRRDGLNHFNIQILRAGRMAAGTPGEERAMRPGDVAVFDTSRPQRTVVGSADYVVLSLPRDVVETALPDAHRLHGMVLPRETAGLLGDFMLALIRNAPTLGANLAARGGAMVVDLLVGAAGDAGARRGDSAHPHGSLALHRMRADAYIDAHLSDPNLSADAVAAALGLSRSTLYRAFASVDGVARRITARRIDRLRAALRQPGEHRSIAALTFDLGFASESHCSRAFKAAFGMAPGRFRAGASLAPVVREVEESQMADWLCEMH